MRSLNSVEERLGRLEAYEGIRQCIFSYALAGDLGNDSKIVSRLFLEDASYEAVGMGCFVGRQAIVEGLAEIGRSVVLWSFHAPGGPLIQLSEDAASAKAFWWIWCPVRLKDECGEEMAHWGAGHYNADLVCEDGTWKFSRVRFETRLRTPFDGPWTEIEGPFEWPS